MLLRRQQPEQHGSEGRLEWRRRVRMLPGLGLLHLLALAGRLLALARTRGQRGHEAAAHRQRELRGRIQVSENREHASAFETNILSVRDYT